MPKKDKYSYQGWLISDSFWKRAVANCGYNFVGAIIIYIGLLIAAAIIWIIFILGGILVDKFSPLF